MTSSELAIALSMLRGGNISSWQEPSANRLAKRYRLDRLSLAMQQQVSNEMVHALLQQQAATPFAFHHQYITPFSTLGLPGWKIEDIIGGIKPPALSSRLTWMTQVAKALTHLHARGVVHGHIHPAIIRIKDDGNATLTHIGAYTAARGVLHLYTQSIPQQESFVYHAPEFVKMEGPYIPTKEMDVYAFGSTLYMVFTDIVPFDGRHRHLETTVVEIGLHGHRRLSKPDGMNDRLWTIISRCWEYDPANRPGMEILVGALAALQSLELAQPSAEC